MNRIQAIIKINKVKEELCKGCPRFCFTKGNKERLIEFLQGKPFHFWETENKYISIFTKNICPEKNKENPS